MRSSRNKTKKILAIVICLIILAVSWVAYSKLLVVNNVTWNLNGVDCASSANLNKTINLKGSALLKINNQYIEQTIIAKYPCIKSVSITKQLNGNVTINLSNRQPFVNLIAFPEPPLDILSNLDASASTQSALVDYSIPDNSQSLEVDDQGVVYKAGDGTYPYIYISNRRFKIGDHLDPDILDAVKAVIPSITQLGSDNMFNTVLNQIKIKIDNQNMIVLTDPVLLFSLEKPGGDINKDIYNSLISLQLILNTAKMENKAIKSVDLRFDKPVVEYK